MMQQMYHPLSRIHLVPATCGAYDDAFGLILFHRRWLKVEEYLLVDGLASLLAENIVDIL